jgi:hypothetical protein
MQAQIERTLEALLGIYRASGLLNPTPEMLGSRHQLILRCLDLTTSASCLLGILQAEKCKELGDDVRQQMRQSGLLDALNNLLQDSESNRTALLGVVETNAETINRLTALLDATLATQLPHDDT